MKSATSRTFRTSRTQTGQPKARSGCSYTTSICVVIRIASSRADATRPTARDKRHERNEPDKELRRDHLRDATNAVTDAAKPTTSASLLFFGPPVRDDDGGQRDEEHSSVTTPTRWAAYRRGRVSRACRHDSGVDADGVGGKKDRGAEALELQMPD